MLELETSRHIWVQRDQAAEGSAVDRHCPCSPCRTNKLKKQKKANKNKKNHRPVDSAERVHSRTAESSSFTVITKTDLLATWAFQCFNLSFAWDEMIVEKNCNYWHCTAGETSWSWTLETASSSSTNFFKFAFFSSDPWLSQHFIWDTGTFCHIKTGSTSHHKISHLRNLN